LSYEGADVELEAGDPGKFEAAFGFSVNGEKYLFVKWPPDAACDQNCCTHRYSLYAVKGGLRLLTSSFYDCDV
jgi:hypothetical protein